MALSVSVIGFLVGIALLIFMIIKGVNMILASVVTCVILVATSGTGFWEGLLTTYAGGAGGFYASWFFLMLMGGIFGRLVQITGMATKIAKVVTSVLTGKWMALGIMLVCFVIDMLGISGYISCFVMYPICNAMLREKKMDRTVLPMLLLAGGAIANGFAYGLDPVNILPSTFLGTSLGVAPVLGIIFSLVHTTITVIYFNVAQKSAMKKYSSEELLKEYEVDTAEVLSDEELPGFITSLIPFVLCFACVVATSSFGSSISVVISITLGIALVVILQFGRLKGILKENLTTGAVSGLSTLVTITTLIGLSKVIVANPVYQILIDFVMGFDMPMYLTVFFGTSILTALTGSALTGPTLFLESFAERLLGRGIDIGVLHRLTTTSALALNKLPNAAISVTVISICKVKFGPAFKHIIFGCVLPAFVAGLLVAVLATLGLTF